MGGYLGWVVLLCIQWDHKCTPIFVKIQVPRARIINPSWPILILSQGDIEIVTTIKVYFNYESKAIERQVGDAKRQLLQVNHSWNTTTMISK
jgi:hypothetical protein